VSDYVSAAEVPAGFVPPGFTDPVTKQALATKLFTLGPDDIEVALCPAHSAEVMHQSELDDILAPRLIRTWKDAVLVPCGRCIAEEVREVTPRCLTRIEAVEPGTPNVGTALQALLCHAFMPYNDAPAWILPYFDRHFRRLLVDVTRPRIWLVGEYQEAQDTTSDGSEGNIPIVAITVIAEDAPDPYQRFGG
jgi:hypothetical protein